jgi:outer membrane receptor protein involved in Fe transport
MHWKALFLFSIAVPADWVCAQEVPIEEIVVFGELRDTALDELPASVSVIDAEALSRRSARHLEDALALSANVNVASGASRSRFFQIRGIGERGQFIEPLNPSVGVLIDGVDLSSAAAAATLFDVDQIEVFRGPQGTRYGANALAGLINVRTAAPGDATEAQIGVDVANYDSATFLGAFSSPISGNLSARIAFQHLRSDGFLDNRFLGSENTNERDETSVRGKLRWQPSEDLSVDAMLGFVDIDNGYDAFSLDNDRVTLSDEPGRDAQETILGSLAASWSGSEHVAVEATLGLADSDSIYGYDEDWTYTGFHPFGYSSTDYYLRARNTMTTELRLLSRDAPEFLSGRGAWAVGIYRLGASEDLDRDYTFAAGRFSSEFDIERIAAFAQLDFDISESTRLTAGVRIEEHSSDYTDTDGARFEPEDDLEGWRLGVDHNVADALMVYALLSGGYKAGGFNTNGTLDPNLRTYDPEHSTSLEIGLKGDLLDGKLLLRLAVFHMERDEIQVEQTFIIERPGGNSEFIEYIDNGVSGSNSGLEAEIGWSPNDTWHLNANVGLLNTEFDSYINPAGDDLTGRAQPHAPDYQFALSVLRDFRNDAYLEVGLEGRDDFYFSSSHSEQSTSYTSVNATFGFSIKAWELRLWGRNLTDEKIFTRGYFFGNDPRAGDFGYAARSYTQLAEPRRVGMSISRSF